MTVDRDSPSNTAFHALFMDSITQLAKDFENEGKIIQDNKYAFVDLEKWIVVPKDFFRKLEEFVEQRVQSHSTPEGVCLSSYHRGKQDLSNEIEEFFHKTALEEEKNEKRIQV